MKIIIIGGSGLIGSRLLTNLRELGHDAVSASPRSGVNAVTGEGLATALAGAQVVVDVSNSPSFADQAVLEFFQKSTRNLIAAETEAGVKHHVALSVVGADRLPESGYMRAKVAQEKLIQSSPVPYTILRATQFFEFLGPIAESSIIDGQIHLPPALMQPIAAIDVSAELTGIATRPPVNGVLEVAGPEKKGMDALARQYLVAKQDPRQVITDPQARYFGALVDDQSLVPDGKSSIGPTHLDRWLSELSP